MPIFLFILTVLSFLFGASILADAKSAIHETEAFVLFLISAVFLTGASIVEAVNRNRKQIELLRESATKVNNTISAVAEILRENLIPLVRNVTPTGPPPLGGRSSVPGKTYHYAVEGGSAGPYSRRDISEFLAAGVIKGETLIFCDGDSEWRALSTFPELMK